MTTYVADHETGDPLCPRCSVAACIGRYECRDEGCRCACRTDPDIHSRDNSQSTGGGQGNGWSELADRAESTGFPHPVSSDIHNTEAPVNS